MRCLVRKWNSNIYEFIFGIVCHLIGNYNIIDIVKRRNHLYPPRRQGVSELDVRHHGVNIGEITTSWKFTEKRRQYVTTNWNISDISRNYCKLPRIQYIYYFLHLAMAIIWISFWKSHKNKRNCQIQVGRNRWMWRNRFSETI